MTTAITSTEVQRAAAELAKMRSSLASWMKFRSINDRVLAGTHPTKKPLGYAQRVVAGARDPALEQDLADKLHALLSAVMQGQQIPDADLHANPNAAVQLAQIALTGNAAVSSPVATGGLGTIVSSPWFWPAIIVAGVLFTITSAIQTAADVAKDKEEKACIMAGACTDYGFWLKAGGIVALTWFAWRELGVGDLAKDFIRKRRT